MRQQIERAPAYIAIGLAALAAVMSSSRHRVDLDAALLSLLTIEAQALDFSQIDPEQPMQFASP